MLRIFILVVLIIGVISGVFLVTQKNNFFSFFSKAASSPGPVIVSNVTPTSFTVSWFTLQNSQTTSLRYGKDNSLNQLAKDDRDINSSNTREIHYVSLKNLEPNSSYSFQIESYPPSPTYKQFTAPELTSTPPLSNTYAGIVLNQSKQSPNEAVIYFKSSKGQVMSTLANQGRWSLEVSNYRTRDLANYLRLTQADTINFFAQGGFLGVGSVSSYAAPNMENIGIKLVAGYVPFYQISLSGEDPLSTENAPTPTPSSQNNSQQSTFQSIWQNLF